MRRDLVFLLFFLLPHLLLATQLEFPKDIEFDLVPMGEKVDLEVVGENRTSKVIKIQKIKTSCGCTVVEPDKKVVLPGGNVLFSFSVDTNQKMGIFKKSVRIYYENVRRTQTLYIKGIVGPPKVISMSHPEVEKGVSIFSKDCASCHVTPGNGKLGRSLYLSDCAFCHGTNRQGGHGPPLFTPRPEWYRIIAEGAGLSMPGFFNKHGGPRTEKQVQSLLEFLKNPKKQAQETNLTPLSLYTQNCSACHGPEKKGGIGPDLVSALGNHSDELLVKMLREGTSHLMMPSFLKEKGGEMSEEEILKVVEFLRE